MFLLYKINNKPEVMLVPGSQLGTILPTREHSGLCGDISDCHKWGHHAAGTQRRPWTLLNILHTPLTKNYLVPNVNGSTVEKPCPTWLTRWKIGLPIPAGRDAGKGTLPVEMRGQTAFEKIKKAIWLQLLKLIIHPSLFYDLNYVYLKFVSWNPSPKCLSQTISKSRQDL